MANTPKLTDGTPIKAGMFIEHLDNIYYVHFVDGRYLDMMGIGYIVDGIARLQGRPDDVIYRLGELETAIYFSADDYRPHVIRETGGIDEFVKELTLLNQATEGALSVLKEQIK
jgi:hypothetical protein